jgi:hypothetical protein
MIAARRVGVVALLFTACNGDKTLDQQALMDPASCQSCHPRHYDEWSQSMHAFAADDPVFLAMNARGQEETGGALGDFCVRCHAPVALATGATFDGQNLPELAPALRGVTCYFCHSVSGIEGSHNNALALGDDGVLRGGIADPVDNDAHEAEYSALLDRDRLESSDLCGSCHDIVTPKGVALERTYIEWQASLFGKPGASALSCGNCHMPGMLAPAADVEGVGLRSVHDHRMPAIDSASIPWPGREAYAAAVQQELRGVLIAQLCVSPPLAETPIDVTLENAFAGHNFPSGAAQDRRAWVEVMAYEGERLILASGDVPAGESVVGLDDPRLWLLRDAIFDEQDREVHMFWEAARYESNLLPQASTSGEIHSRTQSYAVPLADGIPDRVTLRVRMQPIGVDVIDSLIDSGHLDAAQRDALPELSVVEPIEWRQAEHGYGCVPPDAF